MDLDTSAAAGGEQTPAPAVPVESSSIASPASEPSTQTDTPVVANKQPDADPWDRAIAEATKEEAAEPAEPVTPPSEQKDAPPVGEAPKGDQPIDDAQILADAFADPDAEEPTAEAAAPAEAQTPEDKDKEIDQLDPAEMRKELKPFRAAYLARMEKYATPLKQLKYDEIDAATALNSLEAALGPDKLFTLKQAATHELVDSNPGATFQRAYAIRMQQIDPNWDPAQTPIPTLDEMIQRATAPPAETPEAASAPAYTGPALKDVTADLDKTLDFDWRDPANDSEFYDERERTMARALRAAEAQLTDLQSKAPEAETLKAENDRLKAELETYNQTQLTEAQKTLQTAQMQAVHTHRSSLQEETLPFILNSLMLDERPDDTPKVAAMRATLRQDVIGTDYQRANGLDSRFEEFIYNESAVAGDLVKVVKRTIDAIGHAEEAKFRGDHVAEARYKEAIAEEKPTMFNLIAAATREYNAKYVKPKLALFVDSTARQAEALTTASKRVEVVGNGGQPSASSKKPDYASADDVWQAAVAEAAREEALRANA